MDVPLARHATMFTPGKQTSGLTRPSLVGPRDEKPATVSVFVVAPIVITVLAQPGDPTVDAPGPAFPAATQTTTPRLTAASHIQPERPGEPGAIHGPPMPQDQQGEEPFDGTGPQAGQWFAMH